MSLKISCSILVAVFLLSVFLSLPNQVIARRVAPQNILDIKKDIYNQKVQNYSLEHKNELEKITFRIMKINKLRTDQLSQIIQTQANILDEYQNRNEGKNIEAIEKARYWITFAHEAVAYQAAKIYVFELSSEPAIKGDANNLVSLFQSDLSSTRNKVIYSQKILKSTLK